MRKRQVELEGEHRDVAKHVHEYYTEIATLRKLEIETERNLDLTL